MAKNRKPDGGPAAFDAERRAEVAGSLQATGDMGVEGEKPKLPSIPTKLHKPSARKLAELARLEGIDNVAACFDKHFLPLLDDLIIAATERRLDQLRGEKKKG